MWIRRIVVTVVLLAALPALGLIGGFALMEGWKRADARSWELLGTPPEMPVAIVDGDLSAVIVRGSEGALYECDHTGPTQDNACWRVVDQPGGLASDVDHQGPTSVDVPPPPGPVREALDASWYWAERAEHVRYALLEDGSLWLWDYSADANWSIGLLIAGPLVGLALAVAIVLIIWVTAGVRALLRMRKERTEG